MTTKNYDGKDLDIILATYEGKTQDEIASKMHVGKNRISRVLSRENLIDQIARMTFTGMRLISDADFYKKYLHITLGIWMLVSVVQLCLSLI